MYQQETFGNEAQKPPSLGGTLPAPRDVYAGGLLGNEAVQSAVRYWFGDVPSRPAYRAPLHSGPRLAVPGAISRLEALKRERFTPEGSRKRAAKSLAALNQEETIRLTPEGWRWAAEELEVEDQF